MASPASLPQRLRAAVRGRVRRASGTDELVDRLDALAGHLHRFRLDIAELQRQVRVATVMDWIARAELATEPLVSVILPTRDRAELLPRAVASVVAQSYANWELLVVDDGSTDATPEVLAGLDDPRIRTLHGAGRGVCAARNVGLDAARGELVTYVDDDNRMHPEWLRSVVWAFEQRPDADVLYGAFVIDDLARTERRGSGEPPRLFLHGWDRADLERGMLADIGAMAHRHGLPEARFDEALVTMGDWDLLLRLTATTEPVVLPAIGCYYESTAPHRLSDAPTHEADRARILGKLR